MRPDRPFSVLPTQRLARIDYMDGYCCYGPLIRDLCIMRASANSGHTHRVDRSPLFILRL